MTRRRSPRPGFTLLEVLLASVIAVILLAALYVALDVTLLRTDVGREQVAGNDLARAIVNRMTADLTGVLGPMPPKSGGGSSSTAPTTVDRPRPSDPGQSGSTTPPTTRNGDRRPSPRPRTAPTGIEGDTTSPDAQAVSPPTCRSRPG